MDNLLTNATFDIYLDTGGSDGNPGASTAITALGPPNLKFKNADNATVDSNDLPTIPSGATIYSFAKWLFLKCTANADTHTINNLKFYTDGSNSLGTGIDVKIGLQFPIHNSGATTGYEVSDNANEMVAETALTSSATVFNYASGSGLTITIGEAGSVINAANETSNYFVLQCEYANNTLPGATGNETGTISYDEA
jgi:hypothetical protein